MVFQVCVGESANISNVFRLASTRFQPYSKGIAQRWSIIERKSPRRPVGRKEQWSGPLRAKSLSWLARKPSRWRFCDHSARVIHTIPYKQTRFERVARPASLLVRELLCCCACGFIRACSPEPAPAQGLSACSAKENCQSRTGLQAGEHTSRGWSDGAERSHPPGCSARLEK